jgi:hypothetical protein
MVSAAAVPRGVFRRTLAAKPASSDLPARRGRVPPSRRDPPSGGALSCVPRRRPRQWRCARRDTSGAKRCVAIFVDGTAADSPLLRSPLLRSSDHLPSAVRQAGIRGSPSVRRGPLPRPHLARGPVRSLSAGAARQQAMPRLGGCRGARKRSASPCRGKFTGDVPNRPAPSHETNPLGLHDRRRLVDRRARQLEYQHHIHPIVRDDLHLSIYILIPDRTALFKVLWGAFRAGSSVRQQLWRAAPYERPAKASRRSYLVLVAGQDPADRAQLAAVAPGGPQPDENRGDGNHHGHRDGGRM